MVRHESNAVTNTHNVLGILVSTGIDQQPRTVRVTSLSGQNQRCQSALRKSICRRPHSARHCMQDGSIEKRGSEKAEYDLKSYLERGL